MAVTLNMPGASFLAFQGASRNDVAYSEKPVYRALASPQGHRITGTDPVEEVDGNVEAVDAVQWWLLASFELRGLGPLHEC